MMDILRCIVRTWWCKRHGHHDLEEHYPNCNYLWCPNCYEVLWPTPVTVETDD